MLRIQDIFFMGTLHGVVRPSVWNLAYPGKNWTMNNQGGKTEVLSGWKAHQSRPIRRPQEHRHWLVTRASPDGRRCGGERRATLANPRWQATWEEQRLGSVVCGREGLCSGSLFPYPLRCPLPEDPVRRPPTLPPTPHSIRLAPLRSAGPPTSSNCTRNSHFSQP